MYARSFYDSFFRGNIDIKFVIRLFRSTTIPNNKIISDKNSLTITISGGASYGAKGLKPLHFLLQPLQNFCVKQYIVSRSIFLWTKIKTVVTGCHILRLKCTKIDFFWGSAPDPAGGAYSAPPDPLAGFKGPYF